jgi:hypothetical protein
VILVGLIDAGFLYDAMSGRYHPLGEYRKNIKYKVTCIAMKAEPTVLKPYGGTE